MGYFVGKIYNVKITNESNIINDFIPVKLTNGSTTEYAMLDKVTNSVYRNVGTGAFTGGEVIKHSPLRVIRTPLVPSSYTPLEYLQSTGTQYIDTGVIPNTNTSCELEVLYTTLDGTYRTPLSVRTADGATNSFTMCGTTSSANIFAFGSEYWITNVPTPVINTKYTATMKSGVATFAGSTGNPGTTITPTSLTTYMFARNANGSAANFLIGRIYFCKLLDNNTLVRDFIPAKRNSDDELGMYDRVTNTFYTNVGTGTFTPGNPVTNN